MIKPLFINRGCFFQQSPGGDCLRSFIKNLNGSGWEPIIYASKRTPLVNEIPEGAHLTKEYRFVQYVAAAVRRFILPDITWMPGYDWWSWGKSCCKVIEADIKNGRIQPSYIHAVSFSIASVWAGVKLKQKTGLPLVIQFYDPWADNPYRPFKTKWMKKKDWEMEKHAVEVADLIIHNNEAIAQLWRNRYKAFAHKILVLPLTASFPCIDVTRNEHRLGDLLTISHIGNFMLNRTSQPFIRAVDELLIRHPEYRSRLKINYIGMVTQPEIELIKNMGLSEVFNLTGTLSANDCLKYYMESDVFLAIDGVNKDNLFFPSKILKYLYFQRPILGITPKGSVLDMELNTSGHTSIENSDKEGIISYLERAMENYQSLLDFDYNYWQEFEPQQVVMKYKDLIINNLNTNRVK